MATSTHHRPPTLPLILRPRLLPSKLHPTLTRFAPARRPRALVSRTPSRAGVRAAYVSAPASDPDSTDKGPAPPAAGAGAFSVDPSAEAVSLGVVWRLLSRDKLRIAVSIASLVGCTSCVLAMPIFSGRFFEILIGRGREPLSTLLSKIAVLYTLEPIFTVIYVVNMTAIWEKVMASLRGQIFRRMLIQKVEFFDTYKVGELTGLLTSDLGSLKDVVSENISRDRGLRALSEVIGTLCILFSLSAQLAPFLGLLMLSVSGLVAIFKRSTVPVFKSHGMVQASIADLATETFAAIRTVRSFGGEKRQLNMFRNLRYYIVAVTGAVVN